MKYQLLGHCIEAAAALVIANGRVSTMDRSRARLQTIEMALNIYNEAEHRALAPGFAVP